MSTVWRKKVTTKSYKRLSLRLDFVRKIKASTKHYDIITWR